MLSEEQRRAAGRLTAAYLVAVWGEYLRRFPFDTLDLLLISTIASSNLAADRIAAPQSRLGEKNPPRIGVSRNQVSRLTHVPLETVRRRVAVLLQKKILAEQSDGLVFAVNNPAGLGDNAEVAEFNLARLRELVRSLKAIGVDLD